MCTYSFFLQILWLWIPTLHIHTSSYLRIWPGWDSEIRNSSFLTTQRDSRSLPVSWPLRALLYLRDSLLGCGPLQVHTLDCVMTEAGQRNGESSSFRGGVWDVALFHGKYRAPAPLQLLTPIAVQRNSRGSECSWATTEDSSHSLTFMITHLHTT